MSAAMTGQAQGVVACLACGETVTVGACDASVCPHCGSPVRTWWTATAEPSWFLYLGGVLSLGLSCYQPAFAFKSTDRLHFPMTFFDAMVELFQQGSWEFSAVILLATFVVPTFRVLALGGLLWADDFGMQTWRLERTLLLRTMRALGRWTFLDVFAVAALAAACSFGAPLSLSVGPGLWLYCLSSVLMHAAAVSFDVRRIWASS